MKRDAMLAALEREIGGVRWTRPEGVAYVAGRSFFVDDSGANTMRLTFAKEDAAAIAEGVRRLARAVKAAAPALRPRLPEPRDQRR